MIRKYHNHKLQTNPRHHEEEPQDIYSNNTVSHFSYAPPFQGPRFFLQKCWNQTFSMIIYVLTFYQLDYIEKISKSLM